MIVQCRGGIGHTGSQVPVFNIRSATPIEVAYTATSIGGLPYTLSNLYKVHGRIRHAGRGRSFLIGSGPVVTNQAVNVIGICEIERFIFPTIANMTAGTSWPVCGQGDAITVDQVLLSKGIITQPVPVPGVHQVLINAIVAKQAGFGNFLGRGKRAFDKFRMVLLGKYSNAKH
jgi:hypothetical protein